MSNLRYTFYKLMLPGGGLSLITRTRTVPAKALISCTKPRLTANLYILKGPCCTEEMQFYSFTFSVENSPLVVRQTINLTYKTVDTDDK